MDNTNNEKDLDTQLEEVHKKLELNAMQRELEQMKRKMILVEDVYLLELLVVEP